MTIYFFVFSVYGNANLLDKLGRQPVGKEKPGAQVLARRTGTWLHISPLMSRNTKTTWGSERPCINQRSFSEERLSHEEWEVSGSTKKREREGRGEVNRGKEEKKKEEEKTVKEEDKEKEERVTGKTRHRGLRL